jgi:hypothetical protein
VLQSSTDGQSVEYGLCSDGGVQSSDDSKVIMSIKIEEEEIQIKEEDEPIAISFTSIKDEPEVSPQTFHQYTLLLSVIIPFCQPAFPHISAHCGIWKLSVYIQRVCEIGGLNENR